MAFLPIPSPPCPNQKRQHFYLTKMLLAPSFDLRTQQPILQTLIIIINTVMLTRKGPEIATVKQASPKRARRTKLIEKSISKTGIRKLAKNLLRRGSSAGNKKTSSECAISDSSRRGDINALIDQSMCECPICLQIAINPIVTHCGHVYCLKCFEEYSLFNLRCCLCRLQIDPTEVQSALLVQHIIKRFILPTTDEEINYWCRKGQFEEWEGKRRMDLKTLRVGDNIDVRTEDNTWRRGAIVCFKYEGQEYCVEVKVCMQAEIKHCLFPVAYRGLAPYGFFTKGHYQKYRTTNYESKFVESIEIPEIKCDFAEQWSSVEVSQCGEGGSQGGNDLALELFEYQMKEWENVFQLS